MPFTQSFTSKHTKNPLKCSTIDNNLGKNFYPRLIAIYNNLIEALLLKNSTYLKNSVIPELSS